MNQGVELLNQFSAAAGQLLVDAVYRVRSDADKAIKEVRSISRNSAREKETQSPFVRRKEAIRLLGTRSVLEDCEKGGWLVASVRRPRIVLYQRIDVMAAVYRISEGEYP